MYILTLPPLVFSILTVALPFYRTCFSSDNVLPAIGIVFCILFQCYSLFAGARLTETRYPKTWTSRRLQLWISVVMVLEPLAIFAYMTALHFEQVPDETESCKACIQDPTWIGEHVWWLLAGLLLFKISRGYPNEDYYTNGALNKLQGTNASHESSSSSFKDVHESETAELELSASRDVEASVSLKSTLGSSKKKDKEREKEKKKVRYKKEEQVTADVENPSAGMDQDDGEGTTY